jgi:hypothetical protein
VCASFDRDGAWLSLGTPHSRHGFVELSALPRFDERRRGDAAAVRRYRGLMIESRFAFLRLDSPGWGRQVHADAPAGRNELEQRWRLTAEEHDPPHPVLHFRGTLDRPAFAEITEVSPPPPTGATTSLHAETRMLRVQARDLPALATIRVTGSSLAWKVAGGAASLVVDRHEPTGAGLDVLVVCSLSESEA